MLHPIHDFGVYRVTESSWRFHVIDPTSFLPSPHKNLVLADTHEEGLDVKRIGLSWVAAISQREAAARDLKEVKRLVFGPFSSSKRDGSFQRSLELSASLEQRVDVYERGGLRGAERQPR